MSGKNHKSGALDLTDHARHSNRFHFFLLILICIIAFILWWLWQRQPMRLSTQTVEKTGPILSNNAKTNRDTNIGSEEIADGAIKTADIANGSITFDKLGQSGCGINQVIKWSGLSWGCADETASLHSSRISSTTIDSTTIYTTIVNGALTISELEQSGCNSGQTIKWNDSIWECAADVDTTYTAGSGLSLAGTTNTISLDLAANSGLALDGNALTLLNTCSDSQYLTWSSSTSSWGCTSSASAPNTFQTISGDSGSAVTDNSADTLTLVGGDGITSTASDASDTVTLDIDLASGSGLTLSSGALTLQSCADNQVLKYTSGSWACASSLPTAAYTQQLSGTDNRVVGSSLTPLLTNGSGTAQSLGITVGAGNEVSFSSTIQVSSTLVTGPVNYVVIRDDNHDNDCVTGSGDGTQIGAQVSSFIASVAQNFTTTIAFSDTSPATGTNYYQLCASTTIATGTTTVTNRALKLDETNL